MKKIKILVGVVIIGIVFWQFGLFNRFNYLTAKIDIIRNQPRIVQVGIPIYQGVAYISLNEDYGFYVSNVGCLITKPQLRGIESYNAEVEKYLIRKNGENWRKKYQSELDSLIALGYME